MSLTKFLLGVVILFVILMFFIFIYSYNLPRADTAATKAIHAQTVKYISTELEKCRLGETSIVSGNLNCDSVNPNSLALAVSKNSDDVNPYDLSVKAVIIKKNWDALDSSKSKLGYVILHSGSDKESLYITTFLKEVDDADPEKDLLTTSIKIEIK